MGNLIFNSISTEDLGLIIQAPPVYTFPSKDLSTQHVPGRNGDLIIDNKSFNNVDRVYSIGSVFRPGTNFIANAQKIIEWLASSKGYCRLEDSYDPLVFRLAEYQASNSLTDYYGKATAINVTFNCKPQRYLKGGEKEVAFTGSEAIIENPTKETSLPRITISGITYTDKDVVLMTVSNFDTSSVTSTITISQLPKNSMVIDSEEQSAFYKDDAGHAEDLNRYLNLNGSDFPKFLAGKNKISIAKYVQEPKVIENYNKLIKDKQVVCAAKYQPYDAIVESTQKKFVVKSYNNLKLLKEESYHCQAYLTLCDEKSKKYTFDSFNNLLKTNGQQCAFVGADSTLPEWLSMQTTEDGKIKIFLNPESDLVKITKTLSGGFVMTSSDKRIHFIRAGSNYIIGDKEYRPNEVISVTFYRAKLVGDYPELDIAYTNMPDWLNFVILYDDDKVDNRSPSKIQYKANADGYYYAKQGILVFKKETWKKIIMSGPDKDKIIGEATWSTWKKAFVSGNDISTTTTYPFKYLKEPPQYENIVETKKDKDGNEVEETKNKVHFTVVPNADLTKVSFKAVDAGYYRVNDSKVDTYSRVDKSTNLPYLTDYDSTKSCDIYYLQGTPDYSKEKDYPTWLENVIKITPSDNINTMINPTAVDFIANRSPAAYYRYSYEDDQGNIKLTNWKKVEAGKEIGVISPDTRTSVHPADESYTIYSIDELPQTFSYTDASGNVIKDIGFYDADGKLCNEDNTPPSWLKVSLKKGAKEDGSEDQITFDVVTAGYYKSDAELVWQKRNPDEQIAFGSLNDDTTIYYMDQLPSYLDLEVVDSRVTESAKGNPETVKFSAKLDGYYRANSNTDWTFYHANEDIVEAKVSEDTTIYYLTKSEDNLSGIKMTVIPRWWML